MTAERRPMPDRATWLRWLRILLDAGEAELAEQLRREMCLDRR